MYAVVCVGPSFDEGDEESFHEDDFIIKGTQWKNELQEYHRQSKSTDYQEEIITETTTDGRTIQKLVRTYPGEETETVEEYEAVEIDGKISSVTHTVTGAENKTTTKQQSHSQEQVTQENIQEQIVTEVTADGRTIQKKIISYPGKVTETIEESVVTQVGDEITEVKRQVVENQPKPPVKETVQSPLDPGKQDVVIVPGHQKVEYDPITKTKTVTEKTTTGYQQLITTVTAEGLTKTQIKTFFDAVEIPGEEEIVEEETTTTETTTSTTNKSSSPSSTVRQVSKQTATDKVDTTSKQIATAENKVLSERSTNESARTTTAISKTTKEVTSSEQTVRIVSSSGAEPITTATASETKVQTSAVSAAQQTKTKQKDGTEKIEQYEETQAKEVKISGIVKVTPTGAVQECEKTVQLTESVTEKIDDDETTIINETLETESQNQTIPIAEALQQLPTTKVGQNTIKAIEDVANVQTKATQQMTEVHKTSKKDNEQTSNLDNVGKQVTTTDSKVVIVSKIVNDDGEEVTEEIRHFPGGREHITKTLHIDGTTKVASKTFYDSVPVEATTTTTEESTTKETSKGAQNVQNTKVAKNIDESTKVVEVKDSKNVTEAVTKCSVDDTIKIELIWEATNESGEVETEEVRHFPGGREHITKLLRIDGTTKVSSKTFYDSVPTEETVTTEETITSTQQSKVAQSTTASEQSASNTKRDTEQNTQDSNKVVNNSRTVKKPDTTTKIELVWETKNENGDIESEEIRHFTGGREHIIKLVRADGTMKVSSKTFYDAVPTQKTTEETNTTTSVTTTEQTNLTQKASEQLSKVASQKKEADKKVTNVTQEIEEQSNFNSTTKVEVVWQTKTDNGEEITEEIRHFPGGREHITKTVYPNGTTKESSKTFYDAVPTDETTIVTEEEHTKVTTEQQLSKVGQQKKTTEQQLTKVAQNTEQISTKIAQTAKVAAQNTKTFDKTNQRIQNTEQTTTKVAQQTDDKKTKASQNTNKTIEKKSTDTTTNTARIELVSTIKQKNGDTVSEEIRHFPGGREHITKTLRVDGTTKMSSKTFYDAVPVEESSKTTATEETKKTSTTATKTAKGIVSTTDTQIAATTTNTTKIELVSTKTSKEGEVTTEHIRHFPGGREHIFKTLRADGTTKSGSSKTVYDAVPVAGGAVSSDDVEEEIEEYEEIVEEHSSSMTKTENSQTSSTNAKGDTQMTSTVSAQSKVDVETSAKKKLPTAPASKKIAAPVVKAKEAPTPVPPPRKKEVKKPTKGK